MKTDVSRTKQRALRALAFLTVLASSALVPRAAGADDRIGIVLSASPSGAATGGVKMNIPSEAKAGRIPIFLRGSGDATLYGVRLSATPLLDERGAAHGSLAFDPESHTIPPDGALRRADISVSGIDALGTFRSTMYAKHGNRTQILGTLTVVHVRRSNELLIAPIDSASASQAFPGSATDVTLLVTVQNEGDAALSFPGPVIETLISGGNGTSQAPLPGIRVTGADGRPTAGPFVLAAGGATTLQVVLGGLKRTGEYRGALRLSPAGHEPVEQMFVFRVKQGPAFPMTLIFLGVAISYFIRRRYSAGRIGRAGQRRLVGRLLSDLNGLREGTPDLDVRERSIIEVLERRLVDISDELELARSTGKTGALGEIDQKIDLLLGFVSARRLVRAMTPASLQAGFESRLTEAAGFLSETTPASELEAKLAQFSSTIAEVPKEVEETVRRRFQSDVDRILAAADGNPTVNAALPIRVLNRVSKGRALADAGRFAEARVELGAAQLAFARLLAEDLIARIPDPDSGPPGFTSGWARFRSATIDALKGVVRQRKGESAAIGYRIAWRDYVSEVAVRLKAAAARERRTATGGRREQLATVVAACDEATAKALEFDPAAVDEYRAAVEEYLTPVGRRPSAARLHAVLEDSLLPPPLTIVAAGLGNRERLERPAPSAAASADSLAKQIRKRRFGLALASGVVAIPVGLVLLWGPNGTWGTLNDGAAMFSLGFGMQAIAAMADARRLGTRLARRATSAPERGISERPATVASSRTLQPEREPAT